MNFSQKILLGSFATSILFFPIVEEGNNAKVNETFQYKNTVDTKNLEKGDVVVFEYSISREDILESKKTNHDFGPFKYEIHSKNPINLKQYLPEKEQKVTPNKTYKFKITATIDSTGNKFAKKIASFTTTKNSFVYLGNN